MNRPEVFIVDDEKGITELCTDILKPNFGVKAFLSAKDALKEFNESESSDERGPDVIVTDIKMPVMGGAEFVQRLRKRGVSCPIIMMSAFIDKENALQAFDNGIVGLIEKPFEPTALKSLVEKSYAASQTTVLSEKAIKKYDLLAYKLKLLVHEYRERLYETENSLFEIRGSHVLPKEAVRYLKNAHTFNQIEHSAQELTDEIGALLSAIEKLNSKPLSS